MEFYATLPVLRSFLRCGRGPAMQFGITIKPDMTVERIVALTRQAEAAGFEYGWIFDSHVLWLEPYPLLTLMAANIKKMKLGPCGTNPAVRDLTVTASLFATLNLVSGARMQLGIGRGDSSRRVLGKKPVGAGDLERAVKTLRELMSGHEVDYEGQPTRLTWAKVVPPVWIAGYGPKVLEMGGRIADGIILQFAAPDLIEWCLGFVKKGAEAAGRDFRKIEIMAAAPVWMSDDLEHARRQVRWFPALVSNHVGDLLSRYKAEELPKALTSEGNNGSGADSQKHCKVESSNSKFSSDDIVARFCVVAPADAHREK